MATEMGDYAGAVLGVLAPMAAALPLPFALRVALLAAAGAAAVGAALANRKHGRLTVNIQCDGDMMYAPGIL